MGFPTGTIDAVPAVAALARAVLARSRPLRALAGRLVAAAGSRVVAAAGSRVVAAAGSWVVAAAGSWVVAAAGSWVVAAAGSWVVATPAEAHGVPRTMVREMVRLQGYVLGAAPEGAGDFLEIRVLDRTLWLRLVDRQIFVSDAAAARAARPEPERMVVRGDRSLLARLADAGEGGRVTLLGERRPGSSELFVAAVDLCPPPSDP